MELQKVIERMSLEDRIEAADMLGLSSNDEDNILAAADNDPNVADMIMGMFS